MSTTLFQVTSNTDANSIRGFPMWVFWLLVVIIVLLFVFILIRDRGIRDKIKKLFSWILKKIRIARINAKISKKKQKKQSLIIRLGREVWEKKIYVSGTETENAEIEKLKVDDIQIKNEIQKIDAEVEQKNLAIEELNNEKDGKVSGVKEKKKPLDIQFQAYMKDLDLLEKEIKDKDRLRIKTAKSITQQMQNIKKTENDEYLSKIEKQIKRKEFEKRITDLQDDEVKISTTLTISREKLTDLKKRNDDLFQKISHLQEELTHINKDYRNQQQKIEEQIDELKKHKNALNIKDVGLQKQLSLGFERLGEIVNESRVESGELLGIYSQLDNIDKCISDLEDRLK